MEKNKKDLLGDLKISRFTPVNKPSQSSDEFRGATYYPECVTNPQAECRTSSQQSSCYTHDSYDPRCNPQGTYVSLGCTNTCC